MLKIIKYISLAFILAAISMTCLVITQDLLFFPIINGLMKSRGTYQLEGDDRGMETLSISFEILFPVIYAIYFGIIYKWFSKKQEESK